MHTAIPNALKHKNTSGKTSMQNSLWLLNCSLQSLRERFGEEPEPVNHLNIVISNEAG